MLCYTSYISLPRYFYLMHNGESEGDEAEWWSRDILQSDTFCDFLLEGWSTAWFIFYNQRHFVIFSMTMFILWKVEYSFISILQLGTFSNANVSSLKGGVERTPPTLVISMTWALALSYLLCRFEILLYINIVWHLLLLFFTWTLFDILNFFFYISFHSSGTPWTFKQGEPTSTATLTISPSVWSF